jgi:hypothetical protein
LLTNTYKTTKHLPYELLTVRVAGGTGGRRKGIVIVAGRKSGIIAIKIVMKAVPGASITNEPLAKPR